MAENEPHALGVKDHEGSMNRSAPVSPLKLRHQHRGVVTAEAKRVAERGVDLHRTRLIRHHVEVALRVLVVHVDGGRGHLVADGKDRGGKLHATGGTE